MPYNTTFETLQAVETNVQGVKTITFIPSGDPVAIDLALVEFTTPYFNSLTGDWDRTKTVAYMDSGNSVLLDVDPVTFNGSL